ncbi:MAG: hypothetical protein U1F43_13040 [Myxococcota bacterium]
MLAAGVVLGAALAASSSARADVVVKSDVGGLALEVDGKPFMVFGMNWGYTPVGENYRYDLWSKPEAFVREVLDREMSKLAAMGADAIRWPQRHPAEVGRLHPREVRHLDGREPPHGALRLHHRRRLHRARSTTATRASGPRCWPT